MIPGYCVTCWAAPVNYPFIVDLIGQATDIDLERPEYISSEMITLEKSYTFYHYFPDKADVFNSIKTSLSIGSRALCKCVDCLKQSMITDNPHYGDGAYGTFNESFSPTTPCDSVVKSHGIDFRDRPYRAVVIINDPNSFVKFPKTGGVLRNIPSDTLTRFELVMLSLTQGQVIRIEKWDGSEWITVGGYDPS